MKYIRRYKHYAALTVGVAAATLSGCSTWDQLMGTEESVEYKSTVRGNSLSVPPDLTQINENAQYRAPDGSLTFSEYAHNQAQQSSMSPADRVLPQQEGIEVRRDGDLRWLVIDRPAEEIYPQLIEFWGDNGFTVRTQNPRAGLIETDWAENRAKIPEGWIRSALGAIIDQVFDSGERERFRTRLERVDGKTEVYVSHQHMYETPTTDGAAFKWVHGKEDPGLNAIMLARMMVYLGTDQNRARELVEQAEKHPVKPDITEADTTETAALFLGEPFDRAWRRVGVAIDSAGFSVDDRDRSVGEFFIRYLDTDTGEKIEQRNFIDRLLGSRNKAEAARLRIKVAQQANGSQVTVLDDNGQTDDSQTARRILSVLKSHM